MAKKVQPTKGTKTVPASEKRVVPPQSSKTGGKTVAAKPPPVDTLKKTIAYFYILSYIPPESIGEFADQTLPKRQELAAAAGMQPVEYFRAVAPEVCRRMVAFHQASREPDEQMVAALTEKALVLDQNPAALAAYQQEVARLAALPGRAKPENRLHRNKGCALCTAPCRYGYFTLVSDPQLKQLQTMLADEAARPAAEQTPLRPVYAFTISHLVEVTGAVQGSIASPHLPNLAYCLLMLGMAKSRMALPEAHLRMFQGANQEFIRRQTTA